MNRPYDLLVFDWDGTLMDSESTIVHAMQKAMERNGVPAPDDDPVRDIIGLGLGEAIERLTPGASGELRLEIRGHYRAAIFASQAPDLFPGVRRLLRAARAAGYRLSVATGKSRAGLDRDFGQTGIGDWFEASRCADESVSKPAPDMLHELMQRLQVPARRTLMIGDTVWDLSMAEKAGCDAVGVGYGVHPAERLKAHRPKAVVPSLEELMHWLGLKHLPETFARR